MSMQKTHVIAVSCACAAALAYSWSVILSFSILLLGGIAVFLYPAHERKKKSQSFEAAVAREAHWMANEIARFPLERVIAMHAQGGMKEEMEKILSKTTRGIPLRIALENAEANSAYSRKFFELLRFASTHGVPRKALEELSNEIASANEARAQAYASKLSFYGVALITTSAILPALAAAYFLLGSSFLNANYSSEFILALFLIGFPLANVALLAYLHELAPVIS